MVGQEGQRASTGKSSGQDKISMNSFNLLSSFFFYIFARPFFFPGYKRTFFSNGVSLDLRAIFFTCLE